MLVLMDMEWVELKKGFQCPTQIAAIRVDESWNAVSSFRMLIRPFGAEYECWEHMAYSGASAEDFRRAPTAAFVWNRLTEWLWKTDELCWWSEDAYYAFRRLHRNLLKSECPLPQYVVTKRTKALIGGGRSGNPYDLAEEKGLRVPSPRHNALNDAETLRLLLRSSEIDRRLLRQKPEERHRPKSPIPQREPQQWPYVYEENTQLVHKKGCDRIDGSAKEISTLKWGKKHGAKFCECCREDLKQAMRSENGEKIEKTKCLFLSIIGSEVFHRRDCKRLLLSARGDYRGKNSYDAFVGMGLRPCRICRPQETDVRAMSPSPMPKQLDAQTERAYRRYREAKAERSRMDEMVFENERQRRDFLTLTESQYMFFGGQGMDTYHLKSCPKLKQTEGYTGFARCAEAERQRLRPCKFCRPSGKMDLAVTIAVRNERREGEDTLLLDRWCDERGYRHAFIDELYYIETRVGKWRIGIRHMPIILHHINLVMQSPQEPYHRQPHAFLSLWDVFSYIRQHDTRLAQDTAGFVGANLEMLSEKRGGWQDSDGEEG